MPNKLRRANATAAAQAYAPKPNGSAVTYGLVGAALLLVATFLAGAFFKTDVTSNPLALLGLTVLAFVAGAALRIWRQMEHARATGREYEKREPLAEPAPTIDVPTDRPRQCATFAFPFILHGLDRPHPPGTFEIRIRKEPLDVSWAAFVETRTILLTGNGTVEALDVRAEDLEHAIRLDEAAGGGPAA